MDSIHDFSYFIKILQLVFVNTKSSFLKKKKKQGLVLRIVYHNFLGLYVNSKYQLGGSDTRAGQISIAKT